MLYLSSRVSDSSPTVTNPVSVTFDSDSQTCSSAFNPATGRSFVEGEVRWAAATGTVSSRIETTGRGGHPQDSCIRNSGLEVFYISMEIDFNCDCNLRYFLPSWLLQ